MMYNPNFTGWPGMSPGGYWSPQRMQAAQPMQATGGWDAATMQPQMDQMRSQLDRMRAKAADGGGGPKLQQRIDSMQGRVKDMRQQRRDSRNAPAQGAQPEPAMWGGGWSGGGMGGMGEMGFLGGGYPPMFGGPMPQYRTQEAGQNQTGATPVAPYNPTAQAQGGGWNPLTQATGMGNMFDTGWGRLVASSTGNQNVFQLENDPSQLFHYDPNAQNGPGARGGWKSMTPESYASYGDYQYKDPRQFGAAASPMMQQWTMRNGLVQGMQGTGAYA